MKHLKKHVTIVYEEINNVKFVIKYLKKQIPTVHSRNKTYKCKNCNKTFEEAY